MEELKIQLIFNIDHFRNIYYQNGQGSLLTNKLYRNAIFLPFPFVLITAVVYYFAIDNPGIAWLIVFGCILILASSVYAAIALNKFLKWKRNTESYLKELSGYEKYSILASQNAIQVSLDSSSIIENWSNITSVNIEKEYLLLRKKGEVAFLFPSKSMLPEEFENLKIFVREMIK